ncbi:F-box protein At2g17036-like [Coffea arabica]|uniref:F-box protein At2g17036-like n=1 Tax=Coffea arabica TaxID=13443 RepID=A0A6P6UKD1_COFAR|nr:F-box protein At2g17036-like [Coffea arabica]
MGTKGADWAWLPELLLDSIINKLIYPVDYVRFGSVCKHWLWVAMAQNTYKACCSKVPMLMIPARDGSTKSRSLYSVTQGKNTGVELPVPYNRRCCGSSHGWLAFAMDDLAIILYHPFSGKQINLPPLVKNFKPEDEYEPEYYVRKVALSADPLRNPDGYEAVAIYGGMNDLAFLKAGHKAWTPVPVGKVVKSHFRASDVIYFEGRMCVVNRYNWVMPGRIVSVDTTSRRIGTVARWRVKSQQEEEATMAQAGAYLVESSCGELLMVNRLLSTEAPSTSNEAPSTGKLKVYKIQMRDGRREEVKNLGDDSIFLGDNQSASVLASEVVGCQPNSIYYSDDYCEFAYPDGPHDMAIFDLRDGSFRSHYVPNPLHKKMPPPLWILSR